MVRRHQNVGNGLNANRRGTAQGLLLQSVAAEMLSEAAPGVIEQAEQAHRIVRRFQQGQNIEQEPPDQTVGQGLTGRGIRLQSPARQAGTDPARQGDIGRDQCHHLIGRLQCFAH